MSRSVRQSKILSLVKLHAIETQEELCRLLREDGFDVTQATVSRDIKVSSALEQCAFSEVVGVLADRSTVLLVCSGARDAESVSQKIQELL